MLNIALFCRISLIKSVVKLFTPTEIGVLRVQPTENQSGLRVACSIK